MREPELNVKPCSCRGPELYGRYSFPDKHFSLPGILSPGELGMSQPQAFPKSIRQSGLMDQVTCLYPGVRDAGVAEAERQGLVTCLYPGIRDVGAAEAEALSLTVSQFYLEAFNDATIKFTVVITLCVCLFEKRSHVVPANFKLLILLSPSPKRQDYRCALLCSACYEIFRKSFVDFAYHRAPLLRAYSVMVSDKVTNLCGYSQIVRTFSVIIPMFPQLNLSQAIIITKLLSIN